MAKQKELLEQMALVVDDLVENAKLLNEAAKRTTMQGELDSLQNQQHEILEKLQVLDLMLKKSALPAGEVDAVKERIQAKLQLFQKINSEFLAHVSHHFRLIQKKDLAEEVIKDLLVE